jgi:type III secretory pathway component EscU
MNIINTLFEKNMEVTAVFCAVTMFGGLIVFRHKFISFMTWCMELALTIAYYPFTKDLRKKTLPITRLEIKNRNLHSIEPNEYYRTLKTKVWHEGWDKDLAKEESSIVLFKSPTVFIEGFDYSYDEMLKQQNP